MKQLKKDMQVISKSLGQLIRKTEQIIKRLDKLEKSTVPKKPRAKAKMTKKAAKVSASDTVLTLIRMSKKGIDTVTLRKKTGFDDNKMRGIVYRLKEKGKIKNRARGVYIKA